MTSVALGPRYREDTLRDLAETEFDVLVVGGGIVGAGAALDAISRGLTVALVEARDWAAGTSSRSSKLIHGGLRYLEQRDFGLVREALRERALLLQRLAPHLVRPVQFLYPLRNRVWERAYVSAGVTLYDTMGGARSLPRHRQLTRRGALREAVAAENHVAPITRQARKTICISDGNCGQQSARICAVRVAIAHTSTSFYPFNQEHFGLDGHSRLVRYG